MNKKGFTLVEVVVSIVLGLIVISTVLPVISNSWVSFGHSRIIMDASEAIERQIESFRLFVSTDPEQNFEIFKENSTDTTIIDNTMSPPLRMHIRGGEVLDHNNQIVSGIRELDIVANWGNRKQDSLRVVAYVAKDF